MSAVALGVPVVTWRLSEVMSRYRISNRDLSKALGKHEVSISRMRTAEEMPKFSGSDLQALCDALSGLAGERVRSSDLLED